LREAAIVIPTYVASDDDLTVVKRILASLREFAPAARVIVVDDRSQAAAARRLLAASRRVRWLRL
jgi:hypothetical protein